MSRILLVLCSAAVLWSQAPRPHEPGDTRLPNGRSQKEEILKADHEKSLQDADELMKLSEELKIDLEKNDRHVLSVSTLKKLDEMEKLVKRIRGRMKRF
jgi:hypothetical protein